MPDNDPGKKEFVLFNKTATFSTKPSSQHVKNNSSTHMRLLSATSIREITTKGIFILLLSLHRTIHWELFTYDYNYRLLTIICDNYNYRDSISWNILKFNSFHSLAFWWNWSAELKEMSGKRAWNSLEEI